MRFVEVAKLSVRGKAIASVSRRYRAKDNAGAYCSADLKGGRLYCSGNNLFLDE